MNFIRPYQKKSIHKYLIILKTNYIIRSGKTKLRTKYNLIVFGTGITSYSDIDHDSYLIV